MEFIPETVHGKAGENANNSHENDSGLQGFELRGKAEKVWTNSSTTLEKRRSRGDIIKAYNLDYYWKGSNTVWRGSLC